MKNKVRRGAARIKRAYTQPWTVRTAKINVVVWSVACLVAVGNFAMGVMVGMEQLRWVWSLINIGLLFFDFTMLKWSVTGLAWRKATDALALEHAREHEAFYAIVMNEYKHP